LRVLLSTERFAAFGGTESYMLTVARELERLGHRATIYSPQRGEMADHARVQGIETHGAATLPRSLDLLLCSDAATCHELASRYPDAVTVFVAHSADYMLQAPPQLGDRCQAVVVLNDRVRRAVQARAWHAPIVRLRQPVDLVTYSQLAAAGSTARTALVLSNYVKGPRARVVEAACEAAGIVTRWAGVTTEATPHPEFAIAGAEIVIGLGRSVVEAMAAGRAAFVYGVVGGDGWVTPERYAAMEADGFAGTASRERVLDARAIAGELRRWDPAMGEVNRDLASAHHSAREHAAALVDLARELRPAPQAAPSVDEELAHLIRLQWHSEAEATSALAEVERLRGSLANAQAQNAELHAAAQQLEAMRQSRRWRLVTRLAAPLDRLRGR
jgi:hypothetical protein